MLKVGLVGATGMVGETFIELLQQRQFPVAELRPFASENSLGQSLSLNGQDWPIQTLKPQCFDGLDLVFFSSGDDISQEWAPQAVQSGAFAIDNSAAFRADPRYPLIVPEVNGGEIPQKSQPTIIANPNCSTIQLVVALEPLKQWGLKSLHVATYQAVSGAGKAAQQELLRQEKSFGETQSSFKGENFVHQILHNCIPEIGSFNDNGFCSEELKIMTESRKILNLPKLNISAFTVRVPALNGHSEAVWVQFENSVTREEILSAWKSQEGLTILDNPKDHVYPLVSQASGTDPVYVGRLHPDLYNPQTWIFWVVADNIRKGAALNGLQIAEKIFC